jgi:hypothetical protein
VVARSVLNVCEWLLSHRTKVRLPRRGECLSGGSGGVQWERVRV